MSERLTVGALRKLIADLPAETPVVVYAREDPEAAYRAATCHETRARRLGLHGDIDEEMAVLHVSSDQDAWSDRYR